MPAPTASTPVRRSRRLKNHEPELEALPDPELPLKLLRPRTPVVDRILSITESSSSDSEDLLEPTVANGLIIEERNGYARRHQENWEGVQEDGEQVVSTRKKALSSPKHRPINNYSPNTGRSARSSFFSGVFDGSYLLIFLVVLGLVYCLLFFGNGPLDHSSSQSLDLPKLFPGQSSRLWKFVSHGKKGLEPFVLLLVHDNLDKLTNCLAKHIASDVVFSRTKRMIQPYIVDGESQTQSLLLNLKPHVENQQPLIFLNVQKLSFDIASDLHYILDVHEPWISGAIYILTINLPNVDANPRNTFTAIQSLLTEKWSGHINADTLNPLITRIANYEYVVKAEQNPCT